MLWSAVVHFGWSFFSTSVAASFYTMTQGDFVKFSQPQAKHSSMRPGSAILSRCLWQAAWERNSWICPSPPAVTGSWMLRHLSRSEGGHVVISFETKEASKASKFWIMFENMFEKSNQILYNSNSEAFGFWKCTVTRNAAHLPANRHAQAIWMRVDPLWEGLVKNYQVFKDGYGASLTYKWTPVQYPT